MTGPANIPDDDDELISTSAPSAVSRSTVMVLANHSFSMSEGKVLLLSLALFCLSHAMLSCLADACFLIYHLPLASAEY
jgi:hypothetical protein